MTYTPKPCPFCGNDKPDVGEYAVDYEAYQWQVVCPKCHTVKAGDSERNAIRNWNERALIGEAA